MSRTVSGRGRARVLCVVLAVAAVAAVAVLAARASVDDGLLVALASQDPAVRSGAVDELASGDGPGMSDLLHELGEDHAPLVKAGLARAIQKLGVTPSELSGLTALLQDDDETTRVLAANLLAPQAASAHTALAAGATREEETTLVRASAIGSLARAGPQARATLLPLLDEDGPPRLRACALQALALVSSDGAKDVAAFAKDPTRPWPERRQAVQALSPAGCATGGTLLVGFTTSTSARLRAEATRALVRRGGTTNLPTLAGLLVDTAAPVRYAALLGLQLLGGGATYRQGVIGRLLDLDPRVQALAAQMVGVVCTDIASTVIPTLKGLLVSTSFRVRYEAALALYRLGDTSGAATMAADRLSANVSQAKLAARAWSLITGA